MYVCICNNVTERDIRAAVDAGARTLDCLVDRLAVSTCCGQCRCFADDVLRAALGAPPAADVPCELKLAS
jgi:bacterioferritin-associated ferredoxin